MLKEVLVVEGKSDTAAIRRALEADTIETGGFTLAPSTLKKIEAAYNVSPKPGRRLYRVSTRRLTATSAWNRPALRRF